MNWIKETFYRIIDGKLPNSVIIQEPKEEDARYEEIFTIGAAKKKSFDWKPYRPKFEDQRATFDCTNFSRLNCAEYVAKKEGVKDDKGQELNLSDLHLSVGSGTSQNGNNLNNPSEYFRKNGVVRQEFCDYDLDMLTNPKGTWYKRQQKVSQIPKSAKRYKGGNHSWVVTTKAVLMDALDYSPIQIAVGLDYRWNRGGIIPPCVNPTAYHAIVLESIDELGRYHIFDSSSHEEKTLDANYQIRQAKSFRDLPQTWKEEQKKLPIFYKAKNSSAVYMYGLGDGKFYLIPSGEMFLDLFGDFGEATIIEWDKNLHSVYPPAPSEVGGILRIEK